MPKPPPSTQADLPPVPRSILAHNWDENTTAAMLLGSSLEGGWGPNYGIGDNGTSFGPFQIHLPAHPGITSTEASDPNWAASYMYPSYHQAAMDIPESDWQSDPEAASETTAYVAERPAEDYFMSQGKQAVDTKWAQVTAITGGTFDSQNYQNSQPPSASPPGSSTGGVNPKSATPIWIQDINNFLNPKSGGGGFLGVGNALTDLDKIARRGFVAAVGLGLILVAFRHEVAGAGKLAFAAAEPEAAIGASIIGKAASGKEKRDEKAAVETQQPADQPAVPVVIGGKPYEPHRNGILRNFLGQKGDEKRAASAAAARKAHGDSVRADLAARRATETVVAPIVRTYGTIDEETTNRTLKRIADQQARGRQRDEREAAARKAQGNSVRADLAAQRAADAAIEPARRAIKTLVDPIVRSFGYGTIDEETTNRTLKRIADQQARGRQRDERELQERATALYNAGR